jgi:mannose-6-phosphate isomerase-like protein (cupin superfamily)
MARLELEDTYLSLDGQGGLNRHPVEGFWETIDTNPDVLNTLVSAYVSEADWPSWEMHPEGDEVLVLIDGRMTMILEEAAGERRVEMNPGATCIVPKGVWHRALALQPSRFIAITYGPGTTHRPV